MVRPQCLCAKEEAMNRAIGRACEQAFRNSTTCQVVNMSAREIARYRHIRWRLWKPLQEGSR